MKNLKRMVALLLCILLCAAALSGIASAVEYKAERGYLTLVVTEASQVGDMLKITLKVTNLTDYSFSMWGTVMVTGENDTIDSKDTMDLDWWMSGDITPSSEPKTLTASFKLSGTLQTVSVPCCFTSNGFPINTNQFQFGNKDITIYDATATEPYCGMVIDANLNEFKRIPLESSSNTNANAPEETEPTKTEKPAEPAIPAPIETAQNAPPTEAQGNEMTVQAEPSQWERILITDTGKEADGSNAILVGMLAFLVSGTAAAIFLVVFFRRRRERKAAAGISTGSAMPVYSAQPQALNQQPKPNHDTSSGFTPPPTQ